MSTFTWRPSKGAALNIKQTASEVRFGDGYVQRAPHGLNNQPEKWDLSFDNLRDTVANAIEDFFLEHGATVPFDWTNPRGQTKRYVCLEFSRRYNDEDDHSMSAKFEQFIG